MRLVFIYAFIFNYCTSFSNSGEIGIDLLSAKRLKNKIVLSFKLYNSTNNTFSINSYLLKKRFSKSIEYSVIYDNNDTTLSCTQLEKVIILSYLPPKYMFVKIENGREFNVKIKFKSSKQKTPIKIKICINKCNFNQFENEMIQSNWVKILN